MRLVWNVFIVAGIGVYVIVVALTLGPALAWRRRDDAVPVQFARNNRIEAVSVAIPFVLVCLLFWLTYRVEVRVESTKATPARTIDVTAFRWSYRFHYPDGDFDVTGTPHDPPTLVMPVGERTRFRVTSADVIHTFWIPAFLYQTQATPGFTTVFDVVPTATGTYLGRCGEFCGLEHAHMTFDVRVISAEAYRRWRADHARSGRSS